MKMISVGKIFMVLLFFSTTAMAQNFQETPNGLKTTIHSVDVEVQFYTPTTVRIIKSPEGREFVKNSLSVIEEPQNLKLSVKQTGQLAQVKSDQMEVSINLETGKISFFDLSGRSLLQEKEKGVSFVDFKDVEEETLRVKQAYVLEKDEAIYGLGILQNGKMSQRNQTKYLIQGNTEDVIPFFQSVKGYGLFWDNYSPTTFADNEQETSFESEVGDGIDYYFMYGKNADGVVACMRNLTGQAPMFPLWTYGFWQSRERYKSQDELLGVVKKFRELNVPIDGIIQDWQYWGSNYLWNAMEFLNPGFPNPQKMVNDAHDMNVHMIISIWSSFGPKTKQYQELEEIDALLDFTTWPQSGIQGWPPNMDYPSGVRVYDAYHPAARDIYWKYLKEGLFSLGIDGWWMDSTEPDHLDIQPEDYDNMTHMGSFRKVRNAYPLMTVGGVYDHQRAVSSDKRVFILTRSAFAGQQRYGANTWTGDVVASWEALRNQIPAGLNFSLTGIPHWNTDIGGFFLWEFKNPLDNPDYRELHARWMQFGTFSPMMRSHGEGYPREIYQFGKKGDPIYDAIEKYIHLRYSLLPYIYSTSWDITANQSSMIRALVMDFADDTMALDINDQFMFGKSLLVCPVTESMYTIDGKADFSQTKSRELYLPKGANWVDFWTGEKLDGGQTIRKETPLDIIPLYVKEGSILPIGPQVQYATEKPWDHLELKVYDGADGSFLLYEDEFDNYNYESGAYSEIPISWNNAARKLTIGARKGSFKGMLKSRKFTITLIDGTTKTVDYNGKKVVVKL
ncbi:glycoside hydrolase family 31 protein [Geofilum rubicundum]|uniref:Alpha-xylosidase n=1 Tax=Geofilum rubicundum JCM 15548 TaxID=1236989 RepID=A0A0E9LSN7_9BACT|nr:TIM-barrel domain-containing protein [Geofilum rubicundum]GAO28587.1 alpha-xylosidase [Geofilum rubicundum JCM 15548]